jgi:hypothetical protein
MHEDTASSPSDVTPRVRRSAHIALRYYKGMYVMHMERFRELRREFWEAALRGDLKHAEWVLQDAHAMAKEAQDLLRKQHLAERRLLSLPPASEGSDDHPLTRRARMKGRLTMLSSPPPGGTHRDE